MTEHGKNEGTDKSKESLPILGSPQTSNSNRAPQMYTEQRESVEEKLRNLKKAENKNLNENGGGNQVD